METRLSEPSSEGTPWPRRLFAPIDIASLVYYRIAFGAIALWEVWRYASKGWIAEYYIDPDFHFTFDGFHWVQPWPGDGMYWHFAALAILAICIITGLFYRAAAALFFVAFTYVFLLEKANYLNHLYLFSLIAFLMIWLPANRSASLDAWLRPGIRSETTPAWALWLLRAQMGLVYCFAAVAKMNGDWLRGWPLRIWLPEDDHLVLIGPWLHEEWVQLFFSYSGLALDLLVTPLLLIRFTRPFAFAAICAFHLTNSQLFGIGIFPWFSIATTLLFFDPDWPRRIFNWPRKMPPPPNPSRASIGPLGPARRAVVAALGVYLAIQIAVPLRHFLYPGNVSWTEEGHNFAWHQKLRDKDSRAVFYVKEAGSDAVIQVRPDEYLTRRQVRKMGSRPHMILEFAHFLRDEFESELGEPVEVRARVECSLNGRRYQPLVDPEVDLAKQRRDLWPKSWVVPLREPLNP